MKPLRAAILGCGSFAHEQARVLVELGEQVELVAFCDRHPERAASLAGRHTNGSAAVFTHHHELIEKAGIDLLVITLPPYGHSDEVEVAARQGIHLLIEKPIALTSVQAWEMVSAAERAGIKTQVGFKQRFGEAVEALKKLIESGESGQPGLFSARYFTNSLHSAWWRNREKSGGQVVEQAIHLLDLARYLVGEASSVYSRQENIFHRHMPDYTIEDVSATVIGFKNRATGVVYATNGAIPEVGVNDYRLVAQNLTAEFSDANHATFHFTAGPQRSPLAIASNRDLLVPQMLDLIQAIRTGGETRTPIREGALSLDLALAANRSAETHAEVSLTEEHLP